MFGGQLRQFVVVSCFIEAGTLCARNLPALGNSGQEDGGESQ